MRRFLLVAGRADSIWVQTVAAALAELGAVRVVEEGEQPSGSWDLALVDASTIEGPPEGVVAFLSAAQPDAPVIVATTSKSWQRSSRSFGAGAADYVLKPYDPPAIRRLVREALARWSPNLASGEEE